MEADDMALLQKLKDLHASGVLSKAEYDAKRLDVIDRSLGTRTPGGSATATASRSPRGQSPAVSASTTPGNSSSSIAPVSPRSGTSLSSSGTAISPRAVRIAAADANSSVYDDVVGQSPSKAGTSPASSPRKKFDTSQKYDPHNVKKSYLDDHERAAMPQPPKGVVGQRIVIPASVSQFTQLKVIQEPEKPKVGVYLGPTGHTGGGVYSTQADVRRKQVIGGPEVSTRAHIGAAAATVSTVTILTAGAPTFQERVFVNTSCIDLISACVKRLGILFPPSNFGMIARTSGGDAWVVPDALVSDIGAGAQLIVVPKEGTTTEIKKAYVDALAAHARTPIAASSYESDSNFSAEDVASHPNQGKALYYANK